MPVDDVGAGEVAFARTEILERLSFLLNTGPALLDEQELAPRMAVPGRARTGLKAAAARDGAGRVERRGLPGEPGRFGVGGGLLGARLHPGGRPGKQHEERAGEQDSFHGYSH